MNGFSLKRIYEQPEESDGWRILVDRIWPRGMSKEKAGIDEWMKEIAPSAELRQWFCHRPELFEEFVQRYEEELSREPARALVERLKSLARERTVTLLYAAKDEQYNQAVVLKRYLERD